MGASTQQTLVVNFNSPELHHLALGLRRANALAGYVRPYVNKGRHWERLLESLPMAGRLYASTFGRRRLLDPCLADHTREAGLLPDLIAAAIGRIHLIPPGQRHRWANELYKSVRAQVASQAQSLSADVASVVAYEGFALPSFQAAKASQRTSAVLNYPVAHHRHRRRVRLEENERQPAFASTWPDFDDWPAGHEERLDEEIRLADRVLLGSGYSRDTFITEGIEPDKLEVVPYGVDLHTFGPAAPAIRSSTFRAIFAGQLTQRKGLSYLLRGYQAFRRKDSELLLVGNVVGDPAPLSPFEDVFRHVAHQTREQLAASYRTSDVLVFPTLVEGMPLVVLEAMACGLPVIATANGPAEVVRDGIDGFIVPERSGEAIADRLDFLYRNREMCVEMGRNAAARAREFTWSIYAARVLTVLRSLPEGDAPSRGY